MRREHRGKNKHLEIAVKVKEDTFHTSRANSTRATIRKSCRRSTHVVLRENQGSVRTSG